MSKRPPDDGLPYRELAHTADVGVEIIAPTRAELFRRAALALADLLVEVSAVATNESRTVQINADDDVTLMHDFLSELLQLFSAEGFIWREVQVSESDHALGAIIRGEPFRLNHHELRREIKGVTYHQLSVERVNHEWRSLIIFDV
jgi:SHS2 domain-containing protein